MDVQGRRSMSEVEIRNLSYEANIGVEIRRYDEFSGIKIQIPENVRHWVTRWGDEEDGIEQWIVPNDVLAKRATKSLKRLLERAKSIKKHCHWVLTPGFLENYKAGNTFRTIDYDDFGEKDVDVLDLSDDQLERVYDFSGYDHWVRRNGELLHRDIQIETWPNYYGHPDKIVEQAKKDYRFVSADVQDNPVWQNHDISGLWEVWLRFKVSPEELKRYQELDSTSGRIWFLEEVIGLKRIDNDR
jgi:hypothetical protein